MLSVYSVAFSEQSSRTVQVTYKGYSAIPFVNSYSWSYNKLYANATASIFYAYAGGEYSNPHTDETDNSVPPTEDTKDLIDNYMRVDAVKKEVLLFGHIPGHVFLVKDVYNPFNWNVSSETKQILNYTCYKAETTFRGRKWVVWFSPALSLPYGPWKLHGLPGIILEAADSTGEMSFKAVSITETDQNFIEKDFATLIKTKNKTPVTYQVYKKMERESFDNIYQKIDQENPNGKFADVKIPRFGLELKYEWE